MQPAGRHVAQHDVDLLAKRFTADIQQLELESWCSSHSAAILAPHKEPVKRSKCWLIRPARCRLDVHRVMSCAMDADADPFLYRRWDEG
jgi:hypothetical protein